MMGETLFIMAEISFADDLIFQETVHFHEIQKIKKGRRNVLHCNSRYVKIYNSWNTHPYNWIYVTLKKLRYKFSFNWFSGKYILEKMVRNTTHYILQSFRKWLRTDGTYDSEEVTPPYSRFKTLHSVTSQRTASWYRRRNLNTHNGQKELHLRYYNRELHVQLHRSYVL